MMYFDREGYISGENDGTRILGFCNEKAVRA